MKLIRPSAAHKAQALAFRQDFFDHGEQVINGSELLDQTDDYDAWLESVTKNTSPETVNPDWVVTDTFFAADDTGEIAWYMSTTGIWTDDRTEVTEEEALDFFDFEYMFIPNELEV